MTATTDLSELTFEQALTRLEEIVEQLDSGDLPLEAAIARFEEGATLKQLCLQRLTEAEARIETYVAEDTPPA